MNSAVSAKINEVISQKTDEDAFFVIDLKALKAQFDLWTAHLPMVTPHYAVKCNNRSEILAALLEMGAGFDCASATEIKQVKSLKNSTNQIVYANAIKAPSHLQCAAEHGVRLMTFDNCAELEKIRKIAPESELLLRIKTDDQDAVCSLSEKFGAAMTVIDELLHCARQNGLRVVGVAYHVGSGGGTGPQAHAKALADARQVFNIAKTHGYAFNVLDIGGGFEPTADEFIAVSDQIKQSLDELKFPENVRIIGEPGRFFAAPVMTLVANVIGVRSAPLGGEGDMVYLSDGIYGNLNCIIYDHQHPKAYLVKDTEPSDSKNSSSVSLWGPTCDGLDALDADAQFSRKLELGDWLYFPNTGAYTTVGGSAFNGFNTDTRFYVVE